MSADGRMAGRVVLLTGGGGLLGACHARTLAAAGATVLVADIREEAAQRAAEECRGLEGRAISLQLDVRDPRSIANAIAVAAEKFGALDVVVNNAALDPKVTEESAVGLSTRFEELELRDWNESLGVNVTGPFLVCQAALPMLHKSASPSIVNISSTYGIVGPDQRIYQTAEGSRGIKPATYSVSKAAIIGLTMYLATYLAGTGIRVNALSPGGVWAGHDAEFTRRYSERTVLGRMAKPEEISNALLFLASDASSYMTGANLIVDGGWTAW